MRTVLGTALVLAVGVAFSFSTLDGGFEIGAGLAFNQALTASNMTPTEYSEGFNEPKQRDIREASTSAGLVYARLWALSLFCAYLLIVLAFAYTLEPRTFTHRRTLLLAIALGGSSGALVGFGNASIGNPFSGTPGQTGVALALLFFLSFYGVSALILGAKKFLYPLLRRVNF